MSSSPTNVYITSNYQQGGVTAHTVVGNIPRIMNDQLRNEIRTKISKDKPITIVGLMGDAEACNLALQIHGFMKADGFAMKEPDGISQVIFSGVPKGLQLNDKGPDIEIIVGANMQ